MNLLLDVVRGDAEWEKLVTIGITIHMAPSSCEIEEPPDLVTVVPRASDIALGFARNWALGSQLHNWARVVLGVNAIDLRALEDEPLGDLLLDALWTAAEDRQIPDEVMASVERLAASK